MSNLKAFFAQNAKTEIVDEVIVSDRFKDEHGKPIPWKVRAITEAENEQLRKASTQFVKGPGGRRTAEIQPDVYMAKVVVASVVFPDLKNAELQKSYGVIGAEDLLKKMLLSGEYARLVQAVQEINGFDKDINELMDEVKN
nr:MAG: phage portal protein [Bacteroidota bacterium]